MGFLDRLLRAPGVKANLLTTTKISQNINVTVPSAHAAAVQHKLEQWAHSKGWAAVVTAEGQGDNVKLSLKHDETLPGKPPEMGNLGDELGQLVKDVLNEKT